MGQSLPVLCLVEISLLVEAFPTTAFKSANSRPQFWAFVDPVSPIMFLHDIHQCIILRISLIYLLISCPPHEKVSSIVRVSAMPLPVLKQPDSE